LGRMERVGGVWVLLGGGGGVGGVWGGWEMVVAMEAVVDVVGESVGLGPGRGDVVPSAGGVRSSAERGRGSTSVMEGLPEERLDSWLAVERMLSSSGPKPSDTIVPCGSSTETRGLFEADRVLTLAAESMLMACSSCSAAPSTCFEDASRRFGAGSLRRPVLAV
jgi:hypothetical protein